MKKTANILTFLFIGFLSPAQTINLEFPYFAGSSYEFKIVQGTKHVVLKEAVIPKNGKFELSIPENYKGYKGMAMWYITHSPNGGGLEFIINNENFSVACLDSIPTENSIVFSNTKESTAASAFFKEQQTIFAKHDVVAQGLKVYEKSHALYPIFEKEYAVILDDFSKYSEQLRKSPLYAARFREIANLTQGIGSILTQEERLKAQNIDAFVITKLNFNDLYTSNHWGDVLSSWVQMQAVVFNDDARFIAAIKQVLNRIEEPKIYTDFVESLTKELTKIGKDDIVTAITPTIKKDKKLLHYSGILAVYQQDLTGKAPDLEVVSHIDTKNGHEHLTKKINLAKTKSKYTLLLFYQSGCGPCEETLRGLEGNYSDLQAKGFRIISLSADTDEAVFQNTAKTFPWKDSYCNLDGMNGVNFRNYAVIGTPTLYVLDTKGTLLTKLATITALLDWIKKKG